MFYYVRRLVETDADAWDILQEIWIKPFVASVRMRRDKALPHLALSHRPCTAMSHHRAAYRNQAVRDEAFDEEAAFEADFGSKPRRCRTSPCGAGLA
jgi:DNA-directed RNA polymerase specialized sigma24 family protein